MQFWWEIFFKVPMIVNRDLDQFVGWRSGCYCTEMLRVEDGRNQTGQLVGENVGAKTLR